MNKKILLSVAIVFMLLLTGILSTNVYAVKATVNGREISGGINRTINGLEWGIEILLPKKAKSADTAQLTRKEVVDYLKVKLPSFNVESKIPGDENSNVGTGTDVTARGIKATVVLYGDVSGDGIIAENDALIVLNYCNNLSADEMNNAANKQAASVCDIDNGTISEVDALNILEYSNALSSIDKKIDDVKTTNYTANIVNDEIVVNAKKDEKVYDLLDKFTALAKQVLGNDSIYDLAQKLKGDTSIKDITIKVFGKTKVINENTTIDELISSVKSNFEESNTISQLTSIRPTITINFNGSDSKTFTLKINVANSLQFTGE